MNLKPKWRGGALTLGVAVGLVLVAIFFLVVAFGFGSLLVASFSDLGKYFGSAILGLILTLFSLLCAAGSSFFAIALIRFAGDEGNANVFEDDVQALILAEQAKTEILKMKEESAKADPEGLDEPIVVLPAPQPEETEEETSKPDDKVEAIILTETETPLPAPEFKTKTQLRIEQEQAKTQNDA